MNSTNYLYSKATAIHVTEYNHNKQQFTMLVAYQMELESI